MATKELLIVRLLAHRQLRFRLATFTDDPLPLVESCRRDFERKLTLSDQQLFVSGVEVAKRSQRAPARKDVRQKSKALLSVLLGFADRQMHTSLAVVGDDLFFAELFDLFNVQRDADVGNALCLQSVNELFDASIPLFPSILQLFSVRSAGEQRFPLIWFVAGDCGQDGGGWPIARSPTLSPERACRTHLAKRIINAFFVWTPVDLFHHRKTSDTFP